MGEATGQGIGDPYARSGTNGPGEAIAAKATAAARELVAAGRWTAADTERLDAAFERTARAALRAPVLSERSLVLRGVAKRVVPERYRPAARRVVVRLDAASRALVAAGSRALDARRGR